MGKSYKGLFHDWEIAVAKKLINEFKNKWTCLGQEDFDDLLQECLTHWYFSKGDYDPAREASEKTFMGRVMRNKLTDLVREREADKRKITYLSLLPGELSANDEESPNLIDKIDEAYGTEVPHNHFWEVQLRIDFSRVLKKLTPQQKSICNLLGEKGMSVKEASDYLKTPRSTIYDELKRIRAIFMKEGFEDYLK